jgi:non-canonical purine NTP pyrophosphatase (RdgB/HAM1 family)
MQITFITGNELKYSIAKEIFSNTDIALEQHDLDVPEIQSESVSEIAAYSARWAANELNKPVVVTDAGYYISALNGFPGPFIKYINNWLTAEDILKLMESKSDRSVIIRTCLAYCEPSKEAKVFEIAIHGSLSEKAEKNNSRKTTSIGEIFIPDGYDKVESLLSDEEILQFWISKETFWGELKNHLENKY